MPGFIVGNMKVNDGPRSDTEFYMTYTWSVPNIFGTKGIDIKNNDSKNAFIMLKECTTPTFTVNKDQYIGASLEYKFAKSITYDDVRLTWYDTKGLFNIIKEWRKTVWDPVTGLNPATGYKKDTSITCYAPDGTGMYGWMLKNSWPSSIRNGDLSYANSDVKMVEVTLTYDWAEELDLAK